MDKKKQFQNVARINYGTVKLVAILLTLNTRCDYVIPSDFAYTTASTYTLFHSFSIIAIYCHLHCKDHPLVTVRKGVPAPSPFKAPTPWPILPPPPFFNLFIPSPLFCSTPFHGIFDSSPHTHANPSCPNPTNQPFLV